ncbi:histidinol dehydrogenase [Thermanaerosceptrum fracticalcis]|uniref:Histidinol dehydrogenase n=1 Tax=Thermanaerosceptrum fracticalcis TaxID=1712410 RepID=A0A7G6E6H5_THEFR|nr:histidinol dehydrogenase [Thermanaerosceptrum fracticalcis]QNB47679.1 histidinol dehydrogenase [Thermanaerosceptrum fracticalcis]
MLPIYRWPEKKAAERIKPAALEDLSVQAQVAEILSEVVKNGDEAILRYTERFDGCRLTKDSLRVREEEIQEAYDKVDTQFLHSLRQAKENIISFHTLQKQKDWFVQDERGSLVGQVYRPLERVGIYVPGGTANYPSSVLMTSLPAVVAGVPEIVMVTPPGKDGGIPAPTLVAAHEAGVGEIYRVGGAQAVAALAYGTESIRPVDKIVGPGNIYVTMAKKLVYGQVGIDMLAGPSEILLIGDGSVAPAYAAADLLSQAEHDKRARAFLVTNDGNWASKVREEVEKQLTSLPRENVAREALTSFGAIILVEDLEEAFAVSNFIAPEHLELLLADPWPHLAKIKHAGAVFLGPYSPEPLGDYWAGPSHVLPTGGTARYASPLGVEDFCKRSSIISYTAKGFTMAARSIMHLAEIEGLTAHGRAIGVRLEEDGL